jgi:hypothetical protein
MTPERKQAATINGTPSDGADVLAGYTDGQLEFLIDFLRRNIAYHEERMQRLEDLKARR